MKQNVQEAYTTLGLEETATPKEVKAAYRRLSAKYHPDREIDGTDTFAKVSLAYTCIKDHLSGKSSTLPDPLADSLANSILELIETVPISSSVMTVPIMLKMGIKKAISDCKETIRETKRARKKVKKVHKNIKVSKGSPLFGALHRRKLMDIGVLDEQLKELKLYALHHKELLALLNSSDLEVQEVQEEKDTPSWTATRYITFG